MKSRAWPLAILLLAACGGSTTPEIPAASSAACASVHGQAVTTLATVPGNIDGLASDGTNLYWLDGSAGTLSMVPVTGGATHVVATFAPLWNGPCGGLDGTSTLFCRTFSLAVDSANVYAAGPLGIVSVPKTGGAPRSLVTLDGKSEYVLGPLLLGGGALFWPQMEVTLDEGQPDLITEIARLDLSSRTAATFLDASQQVATASILTADANNLYWLGGNSGVHATPLTGGPTTTVVASDTLAVAGMAVVGDHLTWVNQQQSGDCGCPGPIPPQLPEMVESVPLAGGASASLITYAMDIDPVVTVLGDASFAYVLEVDSTTSSLVAISPAGGAPTTLVDGTSIDLATLDACSVYFSSGSTLQRVAKPTL
jgi:hypothetical protein